MATKRVVMDGFGYFELLKYEEDELLLLFYARCWLNLIFIADFAMPLETVILGNERSRFLYRSESDYKDVRGNKTCFTCAIALVFANDKDKSCGRYSFGWFIWFLILIFIWLYVVNGRYPPLPFAFTFHWSLMDFFSIFQTILLFTEFAKFTT